MKIREGTHKPAIHQKNPNRKQKNIMFQQNQRINRDQRPILSLVKMRS